MWHLGARFSGERGSAGLDDLRDFPASLIP